MSGTSFTFLSSRSSLPSTRAVPVGTVSERGNSRDQSVQRYHQRLSLCVPWLRILIVYTPAICVCSQTKTISIIGLFMMTGSSLNVLNVHRKRGCTSARLRARDTNRTTETQQGSLGLGEEAKEDHPERGPDQLPVWQSAASEGLQSHAQSSTQPATFIRSSLLCRNRPPAFP